MLQNTRTLAAANPTDPFRDDRTLLSDVASDRPRLTLVVPRPERRLLFPGWGLKLWK
jgi:hypothetical protein